MKTRIAIFLLLLSLCGCTTLQSMGLVAAPGAKLPAQITAARKDVTFVVTTTDIALNAGLLKSDQAQPVSNVAHQVDPLIDAAHAAAVAGDTADATKTMTLIQSLLAALKAYVPAVPMPAATSPK